MKGINLDDATRSLHLSRTLNAPMQVVWQVWTTPKHIAEWWGPLGFTNQIDKMDFRVEGEWRLTMKGPDGKSYRNRSVFKEIDPQRKIVFQHFNPNYLATVLFVTKGIQTEVDWTMVFDSEELFNTVVKVFKADEGLKENVDKLERYLTALGSNEL